MRGRDRHPNAKRIVSQGSERKGGEWKGDGKAGDRKVEERPSKRKGGDWAGAVGPVPVSQPRRRVERQRTEVSAAKNTVRQCPAKRETAGRGGGKAGDMSAIVRGERILPLPERKRD